MKKIYFIPLVLFFTINSFAQKTAIGKYQTKDTTDKIFSSLLKNLSIVGFVVKTTDKAQGTIQAVQSYGGKEFATLFTFFHKENGQSLIEVTFTKLPGFLGGGKPEDWAKKLGKELVSDFPDMTYDVIKK